MDPVVLGSKALPWKEEKGKEDTWFFLEPDTTERWHEKFIDE
jgi:hypothetical protein